MKTETKVQHTPGPWRMTDDKQSIVVWGEGETAICPLNIAYPDKSPAVARANARLIAAAPEILDTLRALVSAHDEQPSMLTDAEWEAARAAIAKAEPR